MTHNILPKKNILIVDDHELFRAGLFLILQSQLDVNLIEIEKITDAAAIKEDIDVILLDICLPGLNGLDGMSILIKHWPDARIMLLSALSHHQDINTALESGASCFLNKNSTPPVIIKTVKSLLNKRAIKTEPHQPIKNPVVSQPKAMLSNRLLEVLALLAEGTSNKVMADQLCISEHTIRNHIATLMTHFDVNNRTQVILAAQRAGYLSNFN